MKPVALSLTEFYTAIDDAFKVITYSCPHCKQPVIFSSPPTPHECKATTVGNFGTHLGQGKVDSWPKL